MAIYHIPDNDNIAWYFYFSNSFIENYIYIPNSHNKVLPLPQL